MTGSDTTTRRAVLVLTATERAVFSRTAATQGIHATRDAPTGSALLGWAAKHLYTQFLATGAATDTFHGGAVRFSDALPLDLSQVAYPTPRVLVERKEHGGAVLDGQLQHDNLWIGWGAYRAANPGRQGQGLKPGWITLTGRVVKAAKGDRLRTATEEGRARNAALFGYQHLEPHAADASDGAPQRYVACIEADPGAVETADWRELLSAFEDQALRLGRAAHSGYGGWYSCEILADDAEDPWQQSPHVPVRTEEDRPASRTHRVWLLSDVAMRDAAGVATLVPDAQIFGLPADGRLLSTECAISTRRYAPWNNALGCREVERQVVEAGSVFTYQYADPIDIEPRHGVAGIWREQGLGRYWVDPPLLRGTQPRFETDETSEHRSEPAEARVTPLSPPSDLAAWAGRAAALARTEARDAWLNETWSALERALGASDRKGPSPSQWNALGTAGRNAADAETLIESLDVICQQAAAASRLDDWRVPLDMPDAPDGEMALDAWLRRRIEAAASMPATHLRWAVDRLCTNAARARRDLREGTRD